MPTAAASVRAAAAGLQHGAKWVGRRLGARVQLRPRAEPGRAAHSAMRHVMGPWHACAAPGRGSPCREGPAVAIARPAIAKRCTDIQLYRVGHRSRPWVARRGAPTAPPMLLPSALRGLRSAQGGSVAAFLGAAWRGLAGTSGGGAAAAAGGSSGGEGASDAATASAAERQQAEPQQLHEHIISVDRSGLINPPLHSHDPEVLAAQAAAAGVVKEPETPLARHLRTIIQV